GGPARAAILIGFVVAALLLPLAPIAPARQAARRQAAAADSGAVRHAAEQITTGARFIVELIPSNPVRAAVDGNLLPLIVFVTIFAIAAAALPDEKRHALTDLADVATQALIRIVRWVLLLAPLGIFAIVAGAVAQFGVQLIQVMAVFIVTVIAGLAVLIAAVYVPVVALVARLGAAGYLRGIRAGRHLEPRVRVRRDGPVAYRAPAPDRARSHSRHVPYHDERLRNSHRGDRGGRRGGREARVIWFVPAGYALFLALLVYRYATRRPRLADHPPQTAGPLASVIVPARNEAVNIDRCARS